MQLMQGALRTYAWGSRTAIAELCGRRVPSNHPEAELWLGAHPADPARLVVGDRAVSLLDAIVADPATQLGERARAGFGDRLPFLLKLLAAEEALSLQAHPSAEQAKEGFAREEAAGIPLDSPERNYRDDSHKPELVVALTRFEALAGFRDPHRTVELLRALDVPALDNYIGLLAGQPDSSGLRALFTTWITLPPPALGALLPQILEGCVRYLSGPATERRYAREVQTVLGLGESYPGDAGVLASLLLNRVTLEPGEGLYLDAGNLHAYLHGLAVEVMANSDNVLRGGLTPKHVDVPELLRVLDFEPLTGPIRMPAAQPGTPVLVYDTPAPEFSLSRIDLDEGGQSQPASVNFELAGPRILLCTAGSVTLRSGDATLELARGEAAWIAAADPAVTASARSMPAQLFSAAVG
ncbi:mannose-6-phosphate isomerase, class I [Rhodococcus sp. NPDC059234]|uniref:mannose-6-phosphate isomerase, class I n=1 Tax=Rhodococcus sp. NPDC059234 TaxID=3346781 RepID=UPI00366C4A51